MKTRLSAALFTLALTISSATEAQTVEVVDADSSVPPILCVTAEDTDVPTSRCPVIKWDGWTLWVHTVRNTDQFQVIAVNDSDPEDMVGGDLISGNSRLVYIEIDPTRSYAVIGGHAEHDVIIRFGQQAPEMSIVEGQLAEFLSTGYCFDCDLRGSDLNGFDMTNGHLSRSDLTNADLRGLLLVHGELDGVVFTDAQMDNAVFRDADLRGANFSPSVLHRVVMKGMNFNRADLTGANLSNVALTSANFDAAILQDADLSGAYLGAASLIHANMTNADLSNADLSSAILDFANLSGADLSGAALYQGSFDEVNLKEADLTDIELFDVILNSADLSDTTFKGSTFYFLGDQETYFSEANLTGADLRGIKFDGPDISVDPDTMALSIRDPQAVGGHTRQFVLLDANGRTQHQFGISIYFPAGFDDARSQKFQDDNFPGVLDKLLGQVMPYATFCNTTMPDLTVNNSGC